MNIGLRILDLSRRFWFVVTAVLLTAVGLFLGLPRPWPQALAFLLVAVWPVWGWWWRLDGRWPERLVSAAGLALVGSSLLMLLLHYWPGAVGRLWLVGVFAGTAVLPLVKAGGGERGAGSGAVWRPARAREMIVQNWHWVLLIVLVVGLRFTWLGYSEFQGDEGVIMARAAAMLTGDDAEIFLHQKGPVEILLPMSVWGLAGEINELWARLVFAWGSAWAAAAVALLARRWFGGRAGWLAGVLFGMMGFGVAFGRIVQYQSLVMLWGTLAVWHAVRFREQGKRQDLVGTAVFLAAGLLAHYDAVLVIPAIVWVVWPRLRPFDWRGWAGATAVGAVILALFYVPFVLNPNFSRTGQYLLQGRLGAEAGGGGLLSWSGTAVWQMVTFYNSLYFVVGLLVCLLVCLLVMGWRQQWAAWLLFLVSFLFYLFIVADPRTHVYTFFPGAVILAAAGLDTLLGRLPGKGRWLGWAVTAVWLAVSLIYVWLMFVDHSPERQRTWAENRPRFYPVTWDRPPEFGLFGFPHQAGWRAAAGLVAESGLPFASNEEQEVTRWYTTPSLRTHCPNFETFVLAANAQDALPVPPNLADDLFVQGEVRVNGRPSLWVYGRQPQNAPVILEAADYSRWLSPAEAAPPTSGGQFPLDVMFGEGQARLLGYDLDVSRAYPGGQVAVTLYWVGERPFTRNYQTFVHLVGGGELLAQHDSAPDCAVMPTTRWEPGQVVADAHVVTLEPEFPAGEIQLTAGMYDLLTLAPLPPANQAGTALFLTALQIDSE